MFQAVNAAVGLTVFAGLMWLAAKAYAYWWRQVARRYTRKAGTTALATKVPETVIITGRPGSEGGGRPFGYRVYGVCRLAIHETGLSVSQIPPFNIMCPPLFLPFEDIELHQSDWSAYEVYSLRMRQLPDIDIIVFPRLVRWIREHVDGPPFGLGV